ncbi:hypothetical protein [Roseomonas indoligenes]|uniref:Uncharacterized protein n=1 Tax=Roseomonas indoligenes TaxID=2820811 RepID=A0A940MVP7_9PROT|nr:hypothetical protein [Pararoseomonas indoligenes]MBP0492861.1 hypothetical protein [Pararoseomonas indoligenes]
MARAAGLLQAQVFGLTLLREDARNGPALAGGLDGEGVRGERGGAVKDRWESSPVRNRGGLRHTGEGPRYCERDLALGQVIQSPGERPEVGLHLPELSHISPAFSLARAPVTVAPRQDGIHKLNREDEAVFELRIPISEFEALRPKVKQALLMCGHALNDLNVLANIFILAANGQRPDRPDYRVLGAQSTIILRLLIGKVHEALHTYQKLFRKGELAELIRPLRSEEMITAWKRFERQGERKTVTSRIRNSYAFHHPRAELMVKAFEAGAKEDFSIFLGRRRRSQFCPSAEEAAIGALLDELDPSVNYDTAPSIMSEAMNEALEDHAQLAILLNGAMVILIESFCPTATLRPAYLLPDPPDIETYGLPFFLADSFGPDSAIEP